MTGNNIIKNFSKKVVFFVKKKILLEKRLIFGFMNIIMSTKIEKRSTFEKKNFQ